jgi:molecular chaperone DnaJ
VSGAGTKQQETPADLQIRARSTMTRRDYYEILGVSKGCTDGELKSAFRKAAMKFHPDRNPGDKEAEIRFKELNEAYQTLSDAQKRAAYDRYGHAAFEQGGFGAGVDGFAASMADIFDDLFGDVMGGRRSRRGPARGSDLRYNIEISLEEAFHGKTVSINLPASVTCEACAGSGAKAGAKPRTCPACGGLGRVRAQQGFFAIERTCPHCHGGGEIIDDPCQSCGGTGRVTKERNLSVNIPPGVEDGTRIRLGGEGEAGAKGGPAGDLYIFVSTKPHPFFQREGADLLCRVPISMVQAALGAEVSIRSLDGGAAKVKIPEGTQSGKQFKVKNKGMPVLRSRETGDLYVEVTVETPQNLTKRQRELLAEFETLSSTKTHPESAGFFARMKDFFENLGGQ